MAYRREHAPSEQVNVLMDTGTAHEDVFSDSGRLFFMTTCRQRDVMCNLASRTTPVQPVAFSWLPLCTDIAKNGKKR